MWPRIAFSGAPVSKRPLAHPAISRTGCFFFGAAARLLVGPVPRFCVSRDRRLRAHQIFGQFGARFCLCRESFFFGQPDLSHLGATVSEGLPKSSAVFRPDHAYLRVAVCEDPPGYLANL